MKQMKKNVVIIGGGIIGGLLALILGNNGFKVAIIDRLQEDQIFSNSNNVKSYALVKGVPAKQVGWISEFGENIPLPLNGFGTWECKKMNIKYSLKGSDLFASNLI